MGVLDTLEWLGFYPSSYALSGRQAEVSKYSTPGGKHMVCGKYLEDGLDGSVVGIAEHLVRFMMVSGCWARGVSRFSAACILLC